MGLETKPPVGERVVVHVEKQGNVQYTYYDDGSLKVTKFRKRKIYWGRIFVALTILLLLCFGIVQLVKAAVGAIKDDGKASAKGDGKSFVFDSSAADAQKTESAPAADDTSSSGEVPSSAPVGSYSNVELRVCIDPGHGDIDNGEVGGEGIIEKDRTLELGLLVRDYLEGCGVTVLMTRDSDVNVALSDRCSTANQWGADLFVSIHGSCTFDRYSQAAGAEAWVNNMQPARDTLLGQSILGELVNAGVSQNLGVKYGYSGLPSSNYQVNMDTVMPSCMLSLGSMADSGGGDLFAQQKSEYARAIGDGIIKTAIDLGAINESGERLLGEQLLSDGKSNIIVN